MALSVSVATVKAKCRISTTDYDSEISALISEQLPPIEFAVAEAFIADTSNTGLQATLNLGAAEVVAGEFLAQGYREPSSFEDVFVGEIRFGSRLPERALLSDPFGLKRQGWQRLSPYLKPKLASDTPALSSVAVLAPEEDE